MAIPAEYLQELVMRSDIVETVSSYVQLRKRGRTSVGLCPFHGEKTPSFTVYPESQSFYCYGCGAGGSVLNFVMRINNVDYVEAVKLLAARAGMPEPQDDDNRSKLRQTVLAANKEAARFFRAELLAPNGRQARAYLKQRGMKPQTATAFGLGYSPGGWGALASALKAKGYSEEELLAAGLCARGKNGGVYDVFRERLMFPIFDLRGNVIGFGGRILGEGGPKYLNSQDTLVFKKSYNLFALNFAKKAVSKQFILAEGYMDVISLHEAGFNTAVATLGTALTAEQAKLIATYADEVIVAYDSDEAGQKATKRAIELLAKEAVKVKVLNIPNAKDPDEFIKKFGAESFEQLLNGASNAIEFALLKAEKKYELSSAQGRVDYLKDAIDVLAGPLSSTERDIYASKLAQQVGVEKKAILIQLEARIKSFYKKRARDHEREILGSAGQKRISLGAAAGGAAEYAKQQLCAAMIKDQQAITAVSAALNAEMFGQSRTRAIFEAITALERAGVRADMASVSQRLDEEAVKLLSRIVADNYDFTITPQDVELHIKTVLSKVVRAQDTRDMSDEDFERHLQSIKHNKKEQ